MFFAHLSSHDSCRFASVVPFGAPIYVARFAKIRGTLRYKEIKAEARPTCANRDARCEFRVNDLVAVSDDKSDRRSSGNGKVACHGAVTATRHVAYIDAGTRSGLAIRPFAGVRSYVSSRFYSPPCMQQKRSTFVR